MIRGRVLTVGTDPQDFGTGFWGVCFTVLAGTATLTVTLQAEDNKQETFVVRSAVYYQFSRPMRVMLTASDVASVLVDLATEARDFVNETQAAASGGLRVVQEVLAIYGPGTPIPFGSASHGSPVCVSEPVPGARSVEVFALTSGAFGTNVQMIQVRGEAEDVGLGSLEICGSGTTLAPTTNSMGWVTSGLARVMALGWPTSGFAWSDASQGAPGRVRLKAWWWYGADGTMAIPPGITVTWFRRIMYGG